MMITRDLIKEEVDRVQEEHLEILYRIIKALETPVSSDQFSPTTSSQTLSWEQFIEATYGSLSDDPIVRGEQSQYEDRDNIL